jgi:hypothetical protein
MRLLREWLSPAQWAQFAQKGYLEVIGGDTGKQYRIYPGAMSNVCEIDEKGRRKLGLCPASSSNAHWQPINTPIRDADQFLLHYSRM